MELKNLTAISAVALLMGTTAFASVPGAPLAVTEADEEVEGVLVADRGGFLSDFWRTVTGGSGSSDDDYDDDDDDDDDRDDDRWDDDDRDDRNDDRDDRDDRDDDDDDRDDDDDDDD